MFKLKSLLFTFTAFFIVNSSAAQDQDLTGKFNQMMENSETYEAYKVIRSTRLNEFWAEVEDTLSRKENSISSLSKQTHELEITVNELKSQLSEIQSQLEESESKNDTIAFLGVDLNKLLYHIIVWVIIAALVIVIAVLFGMYTRSHSVTRKAQKEYSAVVAEFETFKDKAREKQAKLKRELQTAINTMEDMRKGKA